jgi:natural product precursor
MKKKTFSKKLSLNKETVAVLNASSLNQLKGGAASVGDGGSDYTTGTLCTLLTKTICKNCNGYQALY